MEGRPVDRTLGRKTLVELQQQGRATFGGFFDDGSALVAVRTASSEEALAWLTAGGSWDPARLTGRAWSQTL